MSAHTSIEWCDHSFNIAWGCMKVSDGCKHCYADREARRWGHEVFGSAATTPRRTFGAKHWAEPLAWNQAAERERTRARVFCSSMCDVFEDHPTIDQERAKLWPLIRATPTLDWLLLTKRPERIAANLPDDWRDGYPNVWLGTSIESNDVLPRVDALLHVPAALHFVSCEPLLGPVHLRGSWHDVLEGWTTDTDGDGAPYQVQTRRLGWVIAGGESGPNARPCELDWLRTIRDDCAATGVPFLLKQLGGWPHKRGGDDALLDGVRHLAWPATGGA